MSRNRRTQFGCVGVTHSVATHSSRGLGSYTHRLVRYSQARGFTLIELLVVLVILGLLAGLVGPQVMKYLGTSKTKTAHLQIKDLAAALDLYRLEVGRYPSVEEGLNALVEPPPGTDSRWNGPYLKKRAVPKDPWGFDYHYRFPGEKDIYDLYSLGADNAQGGNGEDTDILGWE